MVRVAPGVRISPNTTGLAPGTETSRGKMPRFFIMLATASAFREILARSPVTFGIETSATNSSTISRSCRCRHWWALIADGLAWEKATVQRSGIRMNRAWRFKKKTSTNYTHVQANARQHDLGNRALYDPRVGFGRQSRRPILPACRLAE